ncbi:hypothetical protein V3470_10430 [Flavobacterium oreochromis]|uniref:Uncharacterized protein n=1 Tax=Flavobacterium oreochromis TaxID=2906078 RepID=A0ABW8PAN8_9FLAO|nr:hypothetical protein [Flavobacterium oreochromis]OWP74139.1 hypothetical protein BWG23_14865 [Flavobacterium oreochromis]
MKKRLSLQELSLELPKIDSQETRFLLGGSDYDVDNTWHELNIPAVPDPVEVLGGNLESQPAVELGNSEIEPIDIDIPEQADPNNGDNDSSNGQNDNEDNNDDDYNNDPDPNEDNENDNGDHDFYDHDNVDNTSNDSEWGVSEFFNHYNNANGEPVNLNDIGLRDDVKNSDTYLQMMTNVNDQIEQYVHDYIAQNGPTDGPVGFVWDFNNSYDFTLNEDLFAIGSATFEGHFYGEFSIDDKGHINVSGILDLDFHDTFEDPWDLINMFPGSWDPTGTPFDIDDHWQQEILMYDIRP